MKIAVICANGKAGQKITEEALARGLNVTVVIRGKNKTNATQVIQKDLFALTAADLSGFDAVIDAFGAWTPETLPQHSSSLKHLCDCLSGTNTRLLVVGGAGSLYLDAAHTKQLMDAEDFPAEYQPVATASAQALAELRQRNDVQWTYVTPAADFRADGAKTGSYLLGGETFFVNDNGESTISYADYAIAMIDEVTNGQHLQQRISVIAK